MSEPTHACPPSTRGDCLSMLEGFARCDEGECYRKHREDSSGELRDITYKVPVIHCTPAEFRTELWWAENVDPVATSHGMADYVGLNIDPGDRNQHLLKDRDGVILLAVRTDLPEDA